MEWAQPRIHSWRVTGKIHENILSWSGALLEGKREEGLRATYYLQVCTSDYMFVSPALLPYIESRPQNLPQAQTQKSLL